jgi:hypothetical protein
MLKRGAFAAVLITALFGAGIASAGVTDFLSNLVSPDSPYTGFLGNWVPDGASDIDHIMVSAPASDQVRLQVFGRCDSRICNWGALTSHVHYDGPETGGVRSLSADFNLGYALRHVSLHRLPGNALRYDMVTEFTDGSSRHDYEASGKLILAGSKPAATPAAPAAPAAIAAAPAAALPFTAAGAPEAAAAAPVAAPALAADSEPVAAFTGASPGDCFKVDTGHVYLAPEAGHWKVRDFLHALLDFGPNQAAAKKGLAVVTYYHADEFCRIGRASAAMNLFRSTGEVPRNAMPKEDCLAVNPDKVAAVEQDGDWKVVEGGREIFNYGSDQEAATQAAGIIKSFALNRQCFYDRSTAPQSYWLAH